jgi:uncharacterized protein with PIN domain
VSPRFLRASQPILASILVARVSKTIGLPGQFHSRELICLPAGGILTAAPTSEEYQVGNGEPRFLADDMVGKLARWLRIIGLDVAPAGRIDDNTLMRRALEEDRVLLTRHGRLLDQITAKDLKPRRAELRWIVLESPHLLPQIEQVLKVTGITVDEGRFFTRCLICNSPLEPASKEDVAGEVPEFTYSIQDSYVRCRTCNKVFWRGTHTDRILNRLKKLRS